MSRNVVIAGAGLAGSLLANLLARDGHRVQVFERRRDPRRTGSMGGRSINLALSARGLEALDAVGLRETVMAEAMPMRGRLMHDRSGSTAYQAYSARPDDAINSVSRSRLNLTLLEAADAHESVRFHFDETVLDADFEAGCVQVQHAQDDEARSIQADLIVGADGAFSAVRHGMQRAGGFGVSEQFITHGYKELVIPPGEGHGTFALRSDVLHIWPRGGSMMIALPNLDGSFTCTLFWPKQGGGTSFEALDAATDVTEFLRSRYPDAVGHMPTLERDARENPVGDLATITCERWYCGKHGVLIGDAAHAIVPFLGQGMNAALRDCLVLQSHLRDHGDDIPQAIRRFSQDHKPNGDAIGQLSLNNFLVMRDKVASPWFRLCQRVEKQLSRLFPGRIQPTYSQVSFTTTPYANITLRAHRWARRRYWLAVIAGGLLLLIGAFLLGRLS